VTKRKRDQHTGPVAIPDTTGKPPAPATTRPGSRLSLSIAAAGLSVALLVTVVAVFASRHQAITSRMGDGSARAPAMLGPCAYYRPYGSFPGRTVSVFSSIRPPEDASHLKSYEEFERCTGIKIRYRASDEFETMLRARVSADDAPDLAIIPQPSLLAALVKQGAVRPAPDAVARLVNANWTRDWRRYGAVNGTLYAAPLGANVKSLVWYSPKFFAANHLSVPKTWDELIALSDAIAAKGVKPWCAGFRSGVASGWPGTDWVEDIMLRTAGAQTYDDWVQHRIPFNDPRVQRAFDRTGQILKNPKYVNGGHGDVKSIATTRFQDGGLTIPQGTCALHRQASFYAANWPANLRIGEDGDIFAFYLPPIDSSHGRPVLGAGEFVAAFSDRPEVVAFQTYLASREWANTKARFGGWASANQGLDLRNVPDPVQRLSVELLQDPKTTFRFDGSDMMPAAVGAGTFWTGMINWINGQDTEQVTDAIEASWP
jgi:alpha-glucoside transport system substrate-binding protein